MRYYIGVDWADQEHAVWVEDEQGAKVMAQTVQQTAEGWATWGRWLHEWRAEGRELWAGIEKPEGRVVEFLLDHGVVVYPINPRAIHQVRDRFRTSGAKSDAFDARVLASFVRTDHVHLRPLAPNSEAAQELKLLTRDYQRLVRQQTRLVNQLTATLKEYYPRALELFDDLTMAAAREFLQTYPTPDVLGTLTEAQWRRWAKAQRLSRARIAQQWATVQRPQLPIPPGVVRAKARLAGALLRQLTATLSTVEAYRVEVDRFFAALPVAEWARTLPAGRSGTTLPTLWAELGDAAGRWQGWQHLQAQAGAVPSRRRAGSTRPSASASRATPTCARPCINWRSSRCNAATGRTPTTRSAENEASRITTPCGRSGPSGSKSSSSCGVATSPTMRRTTWPPSLGNACDRPPDADKHS